MSIKDKINVKQKIINAVNRVKVRNKQKIFCIGRNKTGTTSLKVEMKNLGYIVGNQRQGELLFKYWINNDFKKIIQYCNTANFFQDIPFSCQNTYIELDKAFPNSKFILTIRDNEEQWYNSLTKYHSKLWGKNGNIPTISDLKNSNYIYKGFPYQLIKNMYKVKDEDLYNKDILIKHYIDHNKSIIEYFKKRPNDLLVINIANNDDYKKFCEFLNQPVRKKTFPWKNKT